MDEVLKDLADIREALQEGLKNCAGDPESIWAAALVKCDGVIATLSALE